MVQRVRMTMMRRRTTRTVIPLIRIMTGMMMIWMVARETKMKKR
jgi:hypothetical protein